MPKLLRRIGANESEDEFVSKLRVSVADSMRESLKSGKDLLTGLANKVSLNKGIDRMINTADRTGTTLTVLFFDMDNFKTKVNDVHGHEAGDEVLRAFGRILRQATRENDLAGRFSGDEFGLSLLDLKDEDLQALLQRLQDGILANSHIKGMAEIALSIGVSKYQGDKNRKISELKSKDLIHQADVAMSHAKGIDNQLVKFTNFKEGMEMLPHTSR